MQCCGSRMFIPDTEFDFFPSRIQGLKYPGSRFRFKEFEYLTQKTVSKLSEKWSGMFHSDPGSWFFSISDSDSGSRGQKTPDPGIRIHHWMTWWQVPYCVAEVNNFHEQRVKDIKSAHQHFLQEQIRFYQKVSISFELVDLTSSSYGSLNAKCWSKTLEENAWFGKKLNSLNNFWNVWCKGTTVLWEVYKIVMYFFLKRYCPAGTKVGQNWYQSNRNENLYCRQVSFTMPQGTPSREEL